jgi:hypothetical protein
MLRCAPLAREQEQFAIASDELEVSGSGQRVEKGAENVCVLRVGVVIENFAYARRNRLGGQVLIDLGNGAADALEYGSMASGHEHVSGLLPTVPS